MAQNGERGEARQRRTRPGSSDHPSFCGPRGREEFEERETKAEIPGGDIRKILYANLGPRLFHELGGGQWTKKEKGQEDDVAD